MKWMARLAFVVLLWHAAMTAGWAQESRATLHGQVTDPHSAAVPGAEVTVVSEDTGVKQQTTTNEHGAWNVHFLNPGNYRLIVAATGFKTVERRGITLSTSDIKQMDLTLQVGSISEAVTVTGEAPLIDTSSATSGTVITPEMMSEMPLLSRVATLLAGMAPGVLLQDQNNNVVRMWSVVGASEILVNGGRGERSNEFLLDGMPNVQGRRIAFIPPLDAVQEFRVMSNAYDAQYGRQAGATFSMSVKSGGKSYHGSLYEFNQNNLLNAAFFEQNLTSEKKSAVHYNLYGGTIGGPVRLPKVYNGREKTFFFFTFEGTRNQDPRGEIRSLPTDKQRHGDFRDSFTTDKGERVKINIYDPTTQPSDRNGPRTLFAASSDPASPNYNAACIVPPPGTCTNVIPSARISPMAQAILKFVPLPNKGSEPTGDAVRNYVSPATRNNKMASVVARVDHTWSNQHKSFISLRWNHEDEFLGNHFNSLATGTMQSRLSSGISLAHDVVLSPSKVLDIRYSVTRWEEPGQSYGTGFDPTALGFPSSFVSQMRCKSFPRFNIFGNIGGGCGSYDKFTYHNWNASLTQTHGNMSFHYGGEFRVMQEARGDFGNQSGSFDFGNQWTRKIPDQGNGGPGDGSSWASFLLGRPTGGNFPRGVSRLNKDSFDSMHFYGLFFQDDWRVTRRLTLNLGLRWDYERPFLERFNRLTSDFDPTFLSPISSAVQAVYATKLDEGKDDPVIAQLARLLPASSFQVYGAQLFAGVDGHPRTAVNGDFREFQPRAGFAYRLWPRTVIRGGFGRFVQGSRLKGGGPEDSDAQNGYSISTSFNATENGWVTPVDTLASPFRGGIHEPTGSSLGVLTNLGQGVSWDNQNPGRPYSWEYSLHLQQEYKGWLFEIGYSHNKTYGIYWDLNQNNPSFALWREVFAPRFDANYIGSHPECVQANSCRPADRLLGNEPIPNPFQGLSPFITGNIGKNNTRNFWDLLRPLKLLGDQNRRGNAWGKNQYDAMLVRVEHRFKGGLGLLGAFTWSKLFEDTSFWGAEISGPITEHKLGGEDRPLRLSVAPIYEFPLGTGKKWWGSMPRALNAVLGGWEVSGQYLIQSGKPVEFNSNFFYDGKDFHLPRGQRTLDRWFDTTHFIKFPDKNTDISNYPAWTGVQNLPGANFKPEDPNDPKNGVYQDFGTYVRRIPTRWGNVRQSRVNEINLGLMKNFKPTERMKIQFRLETFNAFNHPRFGGPETNPGNENFGRVNKQQQNTARLVQMALKITF